jgi:phosphoribosylamine-glycine ligase
VDALLAQGTRAVGTTRAGAEIEWNKVFARTLLADVAPDALPALTVVHEQRELEQAIASFGKQPVAVKPSGLTGGKGVKVMGPHLADDHAVREYAGELLARGESVLIEEKVIGAEFTIRRSATAGPSCFPDRPMTIPTATTAIAGRAPAAWARCRCPSRRFRSWTSPTTGARAKS